jgi:hypothetical protein
MGLRAVVLGRIRPMLHRRRRQGTLSERSPKSPALSKIANMATAATRTMKSEVELQSTGEKLLMSAGVRPWFALRATGAAAPGYTRHDESSTHCSFMHGRPCPWWASRQLGRKTIAGTVDVVQCMQQPERLARQRQHPCREGQRWHGQQCSYYTRSSLFRKTPGHRGQPIQL